MGYRTTAFVTNPFLHTWNPFHEAFDTYDIHFINSQGNRRGYGDVVWTRNMFADRVNASLTAHFDAQPLEGPEFTYVHYIDVHGPWKGAPFRPNYAAAVRYIDARVVEIYRYFMERYDGDLLFFVTSDHGRSADDDERVGHGRPWRKNKSSVHDFNLRIPFMVLPSRRVTEPRRLAEPSSNVDFVPTLLDWLGIDIPYPAPGVSLLPAIKGGETPGRGRALYAKMSAFDYLSDCIIHGDRKYVRWFDVKSESVQVRRTFDLAADPRETVSLSADFGSALQLLEDAAGSHGLSFDAPVFALDPELERQLQALGYMK